MLKIKGDKKPEVLAALFNNANIQEAGIYLPIIEPMSVEQASDLLDVTDKYLDNVETTGKDNGYMADIDK